MKCRLRVTFVAVSALIIGSSLYPYFNSLEVKIVLFSLYTVALFIEDGLMIAALVMMRNTIGQSNKGKANTKRMINHAAAFILFTISLVYNELSNMLTNDRFYDINWLLCGVIGSISLVCLWRLLWHLGTKEVDEQCLSIETQVYQKTDSEINLDEDHDPDLTFVEVMHDIEEPGPRQGNGLDDSVRQSTLST